MRLNTKQLIELFAQIRGAKLLTFTAHVDARAKKTGNPFPNLFKEYRINGMVNFQYDDGVLRRLAKEGKSPEAFTQGESWHTVVTDDKNSVLPLCRHKSNGVLYLRFMEISRGEEVYMTADGKTIDKQQIERFLPKQERYTNQGLDNPLKFLTFKLESIKELTVDGRKYTVLAD